MRWIATLLACALALLALTTLLADRAQAGVFKYAYSLDRDGGAEVTVTFSSTQPGATWLLVPKWLNESDVTVEE
ncbi:MAG: hypothetical protein QXT74_05285, partial [Candidatus Nezhaarchaeales archaeon]